MARRIGIVACSAPGAALCYETICGVEAPRHMGRYAHPEVSLHAFGFADYMRCVEDGGWHTVADFMLASTEKVAAGGRDAVLTVIERLRRDEGCDAVVLGCTELPLLVMPDRSPLPTLDATRLLARAAVAHALGDGDTTIVHGGAR